MRKLLVVLLLLVPRMVFAQASGSGNIGCPGTTITGTAATSGTANNTVLATVAGTPCPAILVQLDQTSTITGGAITFNSSNDLGTNYTAVPVAQVINQSSFAQLTNPYTLVASTNQAFLVLLNGATYFQVKLTTAISGTATVTPYVTPVGLPPGLTLDSSGNAKVNLNANGFGTLTVSGTVTTTPPSNASTNVAQWNGSALGAPSNYGTSPGAVSVPGVNAFVTNAPTVAQATGANLETAPVTTATTTDTALSCYLTSAASTNATSCKGSAGNVYGIYVVNTTTTNYFLRMYNSSAAPTCSSATGFIETIPALGGSANGGGISRVQVAQGYGTGIGFCLTGGGGSTDNTNAATGIYVTILYK